MAKRHEITFKDGTTEECFCSEGRDHDETVGDWNLFADDEGDEF
jgi:hypothetical protein